MREAGAAGADLLVAATNSDEVNMVCCLTAKNLGTKYTIARIRNQEYTASVAELRRNLKIDMVINQGLAKDGDWEGVLSEIRAVKASCKGRILKVIVETCNFSREEKVTLCRVVSMSGADFIKTSTGFGAGGATAEDVKLLRENVSPDLRVKAAGGIRTFEQAQALLEAGADRIGASALVGLVK